MQELCTLGIVCIQRKTCEVTAWGSLGGDPFPRILEPSGTEIDYRATFICVGCTAGEVRWVTKVLECTYMDDLLSQMSLPCVLQLK